MPARGETVTDGNGVTWRYSGSAWYAQNTAGGVKDGQKWSGAGAPTAGGAAPGGAAAPAPGAVPAGALAANSEQITSSTLQATSAELQRQVSSGLITVEAANAELRRQSLQMAANNLQAQVSQGLPQEQANAEYARLNSLPPDQLIASTVNTVPIQTPHQQAIAKSGTKSTGTTLGDVREINAARLERTPGMEAATIAPTVLAENQNIGQVERFNAAQIDPAAMVAPTTLGPAKQVGVDNVFRNKELALAQALEAQMRGEGPSLARLQLQEATERNISQQMGAIAAQRGIPAGLAGRTAARQIGATNQTAAMQSAQIRMAEMIAAQQQFAALAAQGRGADINVLQGDAAAQNVFTAKQADIAAGEAAANAAALNTRAGAQAGLLQEAAQANSAAANTRMAEQADLNARIALANQLAQNTQNYNAAQLQQGASQFNADLGFKQSSEQATLAQGAAVANQNAFNQRNISQGQIAGGVKQSSLAAGATVGAAQAAANAAIESANIHGETAVTVAGINAVNDLGETELTGSTNEENITSGNANNAANNDQEIIGGVIGGASNVGAEVATASSDRRAKTDIRSGDPAAEDMLDKLAAEIFRYRDTAKDGAGEQLGVMAQDLERSQLGRQMVEESPEGKRLNFAKGLGAALAAMANLNERLSRVEGHA